MELVYVDDILVFAKEPKVTMDELGKLYELKPESVHEPDIYLRANMEKVQSGMVYGQQDVCQECHQSC
jgi:hypothetical protein